MGLLDILLGRTKPVVADLDRLFALPSAAVTLEAAAGFTPTGRGAVCFATVEGAVFEQTHREVQALLDADTDRDGPPVELRQDGYGYSWLVSHRTPDQLAALVNDCTPSTARWRSTGSAPNCCVPWPGSRTAPADGSPWSTSTSAVPSIRYVRLLASTNVITRWSYR